MQKKTLILSFVLLVAMVSTGFAANTSATGQDAASLVYVSSVTMDPAEFFPYETGTITLTLQSNSDQSIGLSNPDIIGDRVHIVNKDSFNTVTYIGPSTTVTYSFLVKVDPPDGTYFPLFTVGTQSGSSIHYPLTVKVDSTEIKAAISERPDAFSKSTKVNVNLSIINPRDGAIDNIVVTPIENGVDVSPDQKFIPTLAGGSSIEIPFGITPSQETSLIFRITYKNGDNTHTVDAVLPITFGVDKMAAVPIVNNVALTNSGGAFSLTGDISNAGLTDAKSMVVTVESPARAVAPYSEYAIGSLASDDFSSFEITFSARDLSAVPLVISWKDNYGNSFSTTKILDLRSGSMGSASAVSGSGSSGGTTTGSGTTFRAGQGGPGGMSLFGGGSRNAGISTYYPIIALVIIAIAGIVIWKKKKWIGQKLKRM